MQKKLWQGKYASVSYTSIMPKEDFRAGGYVVVAYDLIERDRHSPVLCRFAVMQRGEKVGALEVCDRSSEATSFSEFQAGPEYKYFLLAGDTESSSTYSSRLPPLLMRKIHRMYKDIPDYDIVKVDVMDVLSE
jgi:hypothetical protein